MQTPKYQFDCGCEFDIHNKTVKSCDGLPSLSIDYYNIPLDCPWTWNIYKEGHTKGVFQLENHLGQHWAKELETSCIEDSAALISLIRPGCLRSKIDGVSMTQLYANRKKGASQTENVIEALKPVLGQTFFVLTFQEQSMRIAMDIAGYNEEEADVLRKAIGKKDAKLMASLKDSFLSGCKKMGLVTQDEAEEIFGWIRESQRYSFNKSHGVEYGELGYWTAYAKAHFPLHFFSAWITFSQAKQKPKIEARDLLFDCQLFDIPVYPPSLLELYGGNTSFNDGKIRLGLRHVSNIGVNSVKKLIRAIEKAEDKLGKPVSEFSWYEFLLFVSNETSTTVVNNMISVGGLDHMGLSRKEMIHQYNIWGPKSGTKPRLSDKEKNFLRENVKNCPTLLAGMEHLCYTNKAKPVSTKRRISIVEDTTEQLRNPSFSMADDMKWIANTEIHLIGKSMSIHNTEMETMATNTTCREFLDGKDGKMTLTGEIGRFKEYPGKGDNKGRKMCAMALEDKTGRINALCFFDNYEEYGNEFFEGNIITVAIRRSNDGKAIIEKVY